jgi:hypothetical protein
MSRRSFFITVAPIDGNGVRIDEVRNYRLRFDRPADATAFYAEIDRILTDAVYRNDRGQRPALKVP